MPELILPYRRENIPQSTGWWCGPASARIVLSARGIHVPEAELAREIGTHTGGTDHIGWIVDRSFRHRVPDAGYTGVPMVNDPPSSAQRDAFWQHLTRSIRAGHGVVMNWVAPPSNYPRGIKGSASPSYGPGTVYHYVTAMGFDDSHPGGAVWVVDPGFRPFEFWCGRAQVESLIPPKAYAWASAAAVGPVAPPVAPAADPLAVLIRVMAPSTVSQQRFSELLPAFVQAAGRAQINTVNRMAMFAAQLGHESAGLRYMREIASGAAYEGRQDLGNTQPGDGVRFAGRGPIQITGRNNYAALSKWAHAQGYVPTPTYFVDKPEELEGIEHGFTGAVWYWTVARPNINPMSDARDLEGVTRAINGGLNGLQDRRERWNRALAQGNSLLDLTRPPSEEEGFLMALTDDEQREILAVARILATDRHMSLSPFRHLDEQGNKAAAVTTPTRTNFIDGNVHVIMTMMLASLGDHEHLNLLREVASAANDPAKYPDRQAHARLAAEVLQWAEESGRPEIAPPEPPPFTCLINGTDQCGFAGSAAGGPCMVTGGDCVRTVLASGG